MSFLLPLVFLYPNVTRAIKSDFIRDAIGAFAENPDQESRSVIMIDNANIHHSEAFKLNIKGWQQQGIEIFYLPTYRPHLNKI